MKRLLLVYPNNFLQGANGTDNYVSQLVNLFRQIGFCVDQFGYENFLGDSMFRGFEQQNKDGVINQLFLYDFKTGYKDKENPRDSRLHMFRERARNKINRKVQKEYLQDWAPEGAKRYFTDVVNENQYDVIIISYTYLATLLCDKNINAKKIYLMIDSMFIQQYSWDKGNTEGLTIGKLMDEEIERLKLFDEIFCISNDEKIFYEKITGRYIYFLPYLLPEDYSKVMTSFEDRRWDVFFIGFNNPYNVEGLEWFLEKVYPHLDKNLKILLVGSATNNIKVKYSNIDIIPYAPDLDEIYNQVKVAICPMFRGTGMKTKVVEAMAKGIPVVCNERGVDGLPDKTANGCLVTQKPEEFAQYINELCNDCIAYHRQEDLISRYYQKKFSYKPYVKLLNDVLNDKK